MERDMVDRYKAETRPVQVPPPDPRTVEGRVTALTKSIDRLMGISKVLLDRFDCVLLSSRPACVKEDSKPEMVSTVVMNLERELIRLYELAEEMQGMLDRCNL